MGLWELNGIRISFFCDPVDFRPARITKSDCSRHFIVGFSRRIITGTSQDFKFSIILNDHKVCMSS